MTINFNQIKRLRDRWECPYCCSDETSINFIGERHNDTTTLYHLSFCTDCNKEWTTVYDIQYIIEKENNV